MTAGLLSTTLSAPRGPSVYITSFYMPCTHCNPNCASWDPRASASKCELLFKYYLAISVTAYGQVCAQKFPHPRAFDGMLARAPGSLPMLKSDLYASLQKFYVSMHHFCSIHRHIVTKRPHKSEPKTSLL